MITTEEYIFHIWNRSNTYMCTLRPRSTNPMDGHMSYALFHSSPSPHSCKCNDRIVEEGAGARGKLRGRMMIRREMKVFACKCAECAMFTLPLSRVCMSHMCVASFLFYLLSICKPNTGNMSDQIFTPLSFFPPHSSHHPPGTNFPSSDFSFFPPFPSFHNRIALHVRRFFHSFFYLILLTFLCSFPHPFSSILFLHPVFFSSVPRGAGERSSSSGLWCILQDLCVHV